MFCGMESRRTMGGQRWWRWSGEGVCALIRALLSERARSVCREGGGKTGNKHGWGGGGV